jgi:uncharacterized protein
MTSAARVLFLGFFLLSSAAMGADSASSAPEAAWRQTVRKFALDHFKHPSWGYSHCVRDYELAKQMAETDHATIDDDVLFAAAFLHDMAGFKPWENNKLDHSDVGAKAIDVVLKGTDFPKAKLDAVRGAIRTHMYYREPVGPEAVYLHDADGLDWLGAIGVARIFALVDNKGGKPDGPQAVKIIEENIRDVPAKIVSPAGRALLGPRLAEIKQFMESLRSQTDDLGSL